MNRREFITALGGAATPRGRSRRGRSSRASGCGASACWWPRRGRVRTCKARLAAFRQGLEKLGWSEGRNVRIDIRFAAGRADQFQPLAKELVALQPDVMLAQYAADHRGAAAREPARSRSCSSPSPIRSAQASSPAWRGRAAISRACCSTRRASPASGWRCSRRSRRALRAPRSWPIPRRPPMTTSCGRPRPRLPSLAIEVVPSPVETAADIERAIGAFAREPNGGLLLPPDTTTILNRDLVIALAARHRLPAVYPIRFFVTAGGLMSYGTDQVEIFRQAASYVDRILRGAKPADLPVQAPTKYETTLNLKTAKALGLERAALAARARRRGDRMKRRAFITLLGGAAAAWRAGRARRAQQRRCRWSASSAASRPAIAPIIRRRFGKA